MSEESLSEFALRLIDDDIVAALKEGGISEKHIAVAYSIIQAVNSASVGLLKNAVDQINHALLLLEMVHNSAIDNDEVLIKRIKDAVSPAVFYKAGGRPIKNIK